jgi:uncharacterized membrane protein YdjX (TVP38/TMEM64 family)
MEKREQRKKRAVALVCLGLFVAFSLAVCWFVGKPMLQFVSQPEQFRAWVDSHGFWGRLAFLGMVAFQVIIAIVPGEPLEIGAGYAFGAVEGTLLCILGTTLSSVLIFLVVKKFGMRVVTLFVSEEKIRSFTFLQNTRRLNLIAFLLFFIPGTPKDVLIYLGPFLPVRPHAFFLISTLARIPSVITSTFAGSQFAEGSWDVSLVVFLATGAVAGLCVIFQDRILAGIAALKGKFSLEKHGDL